MRIFINQIGYRPQDIKTAVVSTEAMENIQRFKIVDCRLNCVVYEGGVRPVGAVARWDQGYFYQIDFTPFREVGRFSITVGTAASYSFEIHPYILDFEMMMNAVYYFRGQRDVGEWEAQDKHVMFQDQRPERIDASGGWFDATGDYGIHLSHLTHTTYYTPQQTPLSAYVFYKANDVTRNWYDRAEEELGVPPEFFGHLLTEGSYGADHLMRRAAPSGSFYRSIRRGMREFGSADRTRHIGYELRRSSAQFGNAFTAGEEKVTEEFYEVGFRMGGGFAIAALAIAARHPYPSQQFTCEEYLQTAIRAYRYLLENNERYTNDGRWNLVDEYAALTAATEIYLTTRETEWYQNAEDMLERMLSHAVAVGEDMLRWNVDEDMPYFHAAEAGLPVIAAMTFYEADPTTAPAAKALAAAEKAMRYEAYITDDTANPFGYPRYTYKDQAGRFATRFFFPHESTASPWWQGENARLGSLSVAARYVANVTQDKMLRERLLLYAQQCIDWIVGLNPFNICMVHGFGHQNARYFALGRYRLQCPGGVVNGITSRVDDEEGVMFVHDVNQGMDDNWRWGEQWIPHSSWYLYALAMKYHSPLAASSQMNA